MNILKKEDLDILAFDCERVTESGQTIEKVSVKIIRINIHH